MADQGTVRRIALSLPAAREKDDRFAFYLANKGRKKEFLWVWMERVQAKTGRVPRPDVVAVRVADQDEKQALLAADSDTFFTGPHYNGFPAVLMTPPFGHWACRRVTGLHRRCRGRA